MRATCSRPMRRCPTSLVPICVRMGLFAEARKAIGEALRLDPDNADYNLGMGIVVSFSADPSQAMPYLTRYHALRPKDPRGMLALGAASFRAKDYETAAHWLRQAAIQSEDRAECAFLSRPYRSPGRTPGRRHGRTEDSRSPSSRINRILSRNWARSASRTANLTQASSYFDQALRKDRDNYAANFGLLQLYARTGDSRRDQQARRFEQTQGHEGGTGKRDDAHDRDSSQCLPAASNSPDSPK